MTPEKSEEKKTLWEEFAKWAWEEHFEGLPNWIALVICLMVLMVILS